jgi:hypothetical protein
MTGDGVKGTVEPDLLNQLLFILLLLPGGIGKAPHLAERCLITLQCFLFDPLPVRKPWVSRPETVAFFTQAKPQIGNRLQAFELCRVVHQLSGMRI